MKIFYIIVLLISMIHMTLSNTDQVQNSVQMLIDKNCGAAFSVSDSSYCSQVDRIDAAAILSILCSQDLI